LFSPLHNIVITPLFSDIIDAIISPLFSPLAFMHYYAITTIAIIDADIVDAWYYAYYYYYYYYYYAIDYWFFITHYDISISH